jgi:hypothetical protein
MPLIDFYSFSKTRAEAFFDDYVAAGPSRLLWLREVTGLELQPNRQSLVDLWGWVLEWDAAAGYERPTDQPMPIWMAYDPRVDPFTPIQMAVIDAGGYLIAESLQAAVPELYLAIERTRNDAFENQPVLMGDRGPGNIPVCTKLWGPIKELNRTRDRGVTDPGFLEARKPDRMTLVYDNVTARNTRV